MGGRTTAKAQEQLGRSDSEKEEGKKPEGGFKFIQAAALVTAWWAYRNGLIRLLDLAVWFGAHELVARRCTLKPDSPAAYGEAELERLVGRVGESRVRASLKRLETVGLLTFSPTAISFPNTLKVEDSTGLATTFAAVANIKRLVPVPRRTVRLLASGCGRVQTAVIIAHLLRCLYYRRGECRPSGLCKASWIAETFGVSVRAVKSARQILAQKGWLHVQETPQWVLNRWGVRVTINLAWNGPQKPAAAEAARPEIAPPTANFTTSFAPPESDKKPLQEYKHQKPGFPGPTGVQKPTEKEPQEPTLRNIAPEDLGETDRLLGLFAQAAKQDLVRESECDRLKFVSLAEHARTVGREPCRLFAALLRRQLFHFVTQDDEERARIRLKHHLYGDSERREEKRVGRVPLSQDALFVRHVRGELNRRGFVGDVFAAVSRELPDWKRERWERAVNELEGRAVSNGTRVPAEMLQVA